jgi:streptogramin lyase
MVKKRISKKTRLLAGLVGASLCSACGGGTRSDFIAPAVSVPTPSLSAALALSTAQTPLLKKTTKTVHVRLNYALPTKSSLSRAHDRKLQTVLEYISTANAKITIGVTPIGGSTTSYGPTACTTITCTISFTATSGLNSLTFTLTNAGGGTLSSFSQLVYVGPQSQTTLNFTANPVVNSVTLTPITSTPPAGTPISIPLTVNALDAGGATITGTESFVDSNGNPLTLNLSVTNTQAGGLGVTHLIGPTLLTNPGQGPIYAVYNGGWLSQSTVSVSSSSAIAGALGTATLQPIPTATEFSNGITGTNVIGITKGSDGNLWATEFSGNKILRMTTAGIGTEFSVTAGSGPHCITTGPDGNIWFTEYLADRIGRITPSGTVTEFSGMSGGRPVKIISGPDGNLWFAEWRGFVGKITTNGVTTDYPSSTDPRAITLGPDGNLWETADAQNSLDRFTIAGELTTYTYTPSGPSTTGMDGLIAGPDGNLWFIDESLGSLHRYVISTGISTTYTAGLGAAPSLYDIIVGPDNALWFTDFNNNSIDRIDPTTGTITHYNSGITAGAHVRELILGPDGNIWFTEQAINRIGRFVF